MKEIWNKYHEKIITFLLFGVLFVSIVTVTALLGGMIMRIFGFAYKSVENIILFFIIATIISYPLSLIAEVLPKVLLSFDILSKQIAILLYIILDTIATCFGLSVVDYFMETVSANALSIVVVSLLLSLLEIKNIDKKPKGIE